MSDREMRLSDLREYFAGVYGPRNAKYLDDLLFRINFLNIAVADLHDLVRKGVDDRKLKIALARVMSRIFCIVEFIKVPIEVHIGIKYGSNGCPYCKKNPCKCQEKNDGWDFTATTYIFKGAQWTLRKWQEYFNEIYGKRNVKSGIQNLLGRLFKEVCELMQLEMELKTGQAKTNELFGNMAEEICDCIAWLLGIANFYGIDLEAALFERYGNGCSACNQKICICGNFSMKQVDWNTI